MFCSKCGEKLGESVSFCLKCGAKVVNDASNSNQSISQPLDNQVSIQKNAKPITILAIISFLFSLICIINLFGENNGKVILALTYFVFAIIHAIIVLVLANKFNLKATKVMSIIGIVLCTVGFMIVKTDEDMVEGAVTFILYLIAFSIVSFVQSISERNG
jgi:hypothetical protein